MIPLSWSAMQDAQCPYRFWALRIGKIYKEPEGEPLIIGSRIADILKQYRRHCLKSAVTSDLQYILGLTPKTPHENDIDAKVAELVERFINTTMVNVPIHSPWIRVEAKLAFDQHLNPLPEKDGWFSKDVAFRMVSDLAYIEDDALWICDDKSGLGETNKQQLDIYAHLLQPLAQRSAGGKFTRVLCVLNELGKGRMEVVAEYPAGPVDGVRELVLGKLKDVNSWGEFPAVACAQCRYCTIPECPIRAETLAALVVPDKHPIVHVPWEIETREQAEKAVLFLLHAEKITDQIKDMLRGYVQQNGPVAAGGKIAEERENKPWKATQLDRIIKAMIAYGVPVESIWQELSLPESGIEKLARRFKIKERLPMLLAMGERKDYKPRFGLYNDKLS